uniref:Uncharacterized protein n=1 Tax=Lotus japonicus TaxID=34305 RepID=I3S9J6_LOTJA|nr:unknown [Lotus japonicus]
MGLDHSEGKIGVFELAMNKVKFIKSAMSLLFLFFNLMRRSRRGIVYCNRILRVCVHLKNGFSLGLQSLCGLLPGDLSRWCTF